MFCGRNGGYNNRYYSENERAIFERLWRGALYQALGPKIFAPRLVPKRPQKCYCHCHCLREDAEERAAVPRKSVRSVVR